MSTQMTEQEQYHLDNKGHFVIENYNKAKPFSNFFPGIAGVWGIPMWVFYVNRGQCIASFGIEAKDNAIMEFQPANKSYRLTALQGFRTFIKVKSENKTIYWEPFQENLLGTVFDKQQRLSMSAHDLTLTEINKDLGLEVTVNYFTLPEESYPALVRQVTVKNIGQTACDLEIIDGLPVIIPYGLSDWLNKNMTRTVEAWMKVRNLENKAPYYQLNVEVADTPQVKHIKKGNFYFSFDPKADGDKLLTPIVEAATVFGAANDFSAPARFLEDDFMFPSKQETSNRTPSAMSYRQLHVEAGADSQIISVIGHAHSESQLNDIVKQTTAEAFITQKAMRNEAIINEIKNFAFTRSSSDIFNLYTTHTFLDNILRGGLPVSLKTSDGAVAFNVFSRKHGDLERDYNHFVVNPSFYSQGNGNYRDVNQNRRNDIWFNTDVQDNHLTTFLNLSQADGYNPLVVKGTSFYIDNPKDEETVLTHCSEEGKEILRAYLSKNFLPGDLLHFIEDKEIKLNTPVKEFMAELLAICHKQELADHGEGFWTDHWTYNLDLVESYLALYPERLHELLLEKKNFYFYHNTHYVLPRENRYVLTRYGVRQYESIGEVSEQEAEAIESRGYRLCIKNGEGAIYKTNLACKILCLIANKVASLDPSGTGVEMEADKPNWYDSLNGLPGLLGSSVSETFEVKRIASFLLESIKQLSLEDTVKISIFEELANFVSGLSNLLLIDQNTHTYWLKSNDIKEGYRQCVRLGIEGEETEMSVAEIKSFLTLVIAKADRAIESAKNDKGFLATYFYHEVTEHEVLNKKDEEGDSFVRPLQFKKHALPLFLEGYVHALRSDTSKESAQGLYNQVRESDLFDKKLKMYKVNTALSMETEEIGRTRIFPASWLENESIWLHMEYKFILELLRCELYEEFYDNFRHVLVPFLNPAQYGRSPLENSSFIVSSAHEDESLHGQGFVARLSGSTAEFMHMWLYMNVGKNPFTLDVNKELVLTFNPALAGWLFTEEPTTIDYFDKNHQWQKIDLPTDVYAFNFLNTTLVVYHNPQRKDTFGEDKPEVKEIHLTYADNKKSVVVSAPYLTTTHAQDVRLHKVARVDVYFGSS
ncbi:FIG00469293: hypothetical protein [hydrothermal vent metagenome]|uniref:Cellobiose phosphorylase n=1 Tax=hydrothermal vent metagenome TaxID=652676 RepID=A0A3B1D947_9ZZZZ